MKMCPSCLAAHKRNNWYIGTIDSNVKFAVMCDIHPVMTNWRVIRTLKSIRGWDRKSAGYIHPMSRGTLVYSNGVSRSVAEKILFDYEKPFLDLLIKEGYIKDVEGNLSITPKCNELKEMFEEEKVA